MSKKKNYQNGADDWKPQEEKKESSSDVFLCYHNDYSPRYQKPYDIYDKARQHIKKLKKADKDHKVT